MLDVCFACVIQAPHRPDRTQCPRCGGPLTVVDAHGRTSGPRQTPHAPARNAPAPNAQTFRAHAPAPRRAPNLRWTADRPQSARPRAARPRPQRAAQPVTPSYPQIPGWGLHDAPPVAATDTDPDPLAAQALARAFRLVSIVIAAAAVAHLLRYVIVVVNRTTPISQWLDLLSSTAVLVLGLFAFAAMILGAAAFVRWLLRARARAYREAAVVDARSSRTQVLLAAAPLVNVVTAPLLLTEAADCTDDPRLARSRIRRVAIAWAWVNALAVLAACYRISGMISDSLQVSADGLLIVTLSLAVSAIFARWVPERLIGVYDGRAQRRAVERRLVAA